MNSILRAGVLASLTIVLAACATQPHVGSYSSPGFLMGIIHGIISPFALIAGIVTDARVYSFPNSGWWYDFGFMLGLVAWAGGGATATSK